MTRAGASRFDAEAVVVREACRRATPQDIAALRRNVDATAAAMAEGDFPRRPEMNLEFHHLLARMPGNPIMVVLVNAVLDVLRGFNRTIGEYPNTRVLPSRRRFIAQRERGDAEAAVAERQASLARLQLSYLSRLNVSRPKVDR